MKQTYPAVCVFREKQGNRTFVCHSRAEHYAVALQVLGERMRAGLYEQEEAEDEAAKNIVRNQNGYAAIQFLARRSYAENEGVEVITPEVIK